MSDEKYFQLGCCGVRWYKDWDLADLTITSTNITHLGLTAQSVPDSCCLFEVPGCGQNVFEITDIRVLVQKININGRFFLAIQKGFFNS